MLGTTKNFLLQAAVISAYLVTFYGCTTAERNKSFSNSYAFRCNANKLPESEGALFIRGFNPETSTSNSTTPIVGAKFTVERLTKEKSRFFDLQIDEKQWLEKNGAIVNFKPGNYRLKKITLLHQSGIQIDVPFQRPKERFQIHPKCVSYIGDFIFNFDDKKIKFTHKMDSKSYDIARNQMQTDRSSILNGFNPEEFPEININEDEIGMHGDSIAKLKTSSLIKTNYIIDSNYGREFATQLLNEIKKQENAFAKCYSDKLTLKQKSKQVLIIFKFQVNKDEQKLKNLVLSTSPKSSELQSCMEEAFLATSKVGKQYPEDLIATGRISWTTVKAEQTKQIPL